MGIAEGMEALITCVGRPVAMHQHAREVDRQLRGAGHVQPVPIVVHAPSGLFGMSARAVRSASWMAATGASRWVAATVGALEGGPARAQSRPVPGTARRYPGGQKLGLGQVHRERRPPPGAVLDGSRDPFGEGTALYPPTGTGSPPTMRYSVTARWITTSTTWRRSGSTSAPISAQQRPCRSAG